MGDQDDPKPNAQAQEFTVKDRHGNTVTLPAARVAELAGRGLDYETRVSELEAERTTLRTQKEQLEQDGRLLTAFRQFQHRVETDNSFREAVSLAYQDPDLVRRAVQAGGVDDLDDDDDRSGNARSGLGSQVAQLPPEYEQKLGSLESAVRALAESNKRQQDRESAQSLLSSIDQELDNYPWLAGKGREKVRALVLQRSRSEKDVALPVIVSQEAEDWKAAWTESQEERRATFQSRRPLRTVKPDAPAGASEPAKLDRDSFRNGKMKQAINGALDDLLGTARGR